jgi:phage terminase small subunit
VKLTAKQEAFAQAVAAGKSQSDAYREAGYGPNMTAKQVHEEACKLAANPKLVQRIAELRKPVIEEVQRQVKYDLFQAMKEAEEAFEVAKLKQNGGAMTAAATLRAKLNGLLVEKREIRTGPLDDLGRDELKQLRDALAGVPAQQDSNDAVQTVRH